MTARESGMESEMNRGFLQVLALLVLDTDRYGYQMVRTVQQLGYPLEENTLYPLLRRLEKNGWIRSQWRLDSERPKKYYRITAAGRKARKRFLEIWHAQQRIITGLEKEAKQ